jgi:hypothetical protein
VPFGTVVSMPSMVNVTPSGFGSGGGVAPDPAGFDAVTVIAGPPRNRERSERLRGV